MTSNLWPHLSDDEKRPILDTARSFYLAALARDEGRPISESHTVLRAARGWVAAQGVNPDELDEHIQNYWKEQKE